MKLLIEFNFCGESGGAVFVEYNGTEDEATHALKTAEHNWSEHHGNYEHPKDALMEAGFTLPEVHIKEFQLLRC